MTRLIDHEIVPLARSGPYPVELQDGVYRFDPVAVNDLTVFYQRGKMRASLLLG